MKKIKPGVRTSEYNIYHTWINGNTQRKVILIRYIILIMTKIV